MKIWQLGVCVGLSLTAIGLSSCGTADAGPPVTRGTQTGKQATRMVVLAVEDIDNGGHYYRIVKDTKTGCEFISKGESLAYIPTTCEKPL